MSFSFGFLVAACRIRPAACDMRSRPCVRCMLWPRGFPLVPALPSTGSAGTDVPLFAGFAGTMAGSDCFNPFVMDSDSLLSSAAPTRPPGQTEALPSPDAGCTCVPGFLRQRGARQSLTLTVLPVLPSADDKISALRIITVSLLNHPGHTRRCRRFACTLTDAHARLAVEVVADLSFLPDLHRLPLRQFARCSSSWLSSDKQRLLERSLCGVGSTLLFELGTWRKDAEGVTQHETENGIPVLVCTEQASYRELGKNDVAKASWLLRRYLEYVASVLADNLRGAG